MPELPPDADPVPATPIGDLPSWWLHVECRQCRHRVELPLADLAAEYGRRTKLTDVLRRLRCHRYRDAVKCGAKPRCVLLAKMSPGGRRKQREVVALDAPN